MQLLLTKEEMVNAMWNWAGELTDEEAAALNQEDRFRFIAKTQLRKVLKAIKQEGIRAYGLYSEAVTGNIILPASFIEQMEKATQ